MTPTFTNTFTTSEWKSPYITLGYVLCGVPVFGKRTFMTNLYYDIEWKSLDETLSVTLDWCGVPVAEKSTLLENVSIWIQKSTDNLRFSFMWRSIGRMWRSIGRKAYYATVQLPTLNNGTACVWFDLIFFTVSWKLNEKLRGNISQ